MHQANSSVRDTWLDRSKQRWKLQMAQVVLFAGGIVGILLFLRGTWPESFYGAIVLMVATPIAIVMASFVRCAVCGHRVALNAPFGQWWAYMSAQKACPECGDDGTNRPAAPGSIPVWFEVVREVAAKERAGRWVRRKKIAVRVALAAAVVGFGLWISTCGLQ